MSLASQIAAGFTRVAQEINAVRAGTAATKVWNSGSTPNYAPDSIEIWVGTEDPVADGATPHDGDVWFNPSEIGGLPTSATDVSFTDSGLVVVAGTTDVQAALAALDAELGEGDLAYAQFTSGSSPTATTEATAATLVTAAAVSLNGSTRIEVEVFVPFARPTTTNGELINFWIYDGSTSLGRIAAIGTAAAGTTYTPVKASRFLTPSNGSHTYSLRVSVSSGTGSIGAGAGGTGADMPGYIRVKRARA